jgi:hypothetical protein
VEKKMKHHFSDTFYKAMESIQPYGVPERKLTAEEMALAAEHYLNVLQEDLLENPPEDLPPFEKGMLVIYESNTCAAVIVRITETPKRYEGVGEWFAYVQYPYAPEPQMMACKFMQRIRYTNSKRNKSLLCQVKCFDGGWK